MQAARLLLPATAGTLLLFEPPILYPKGGSMQKELPLWHRIYFDAAYTDIVRLVGYAGLPCRDFERQLQKLIEKHGRKAESASWHVVTFEGQMGVKPPPLAQVTLRQEARKLAWQLLGPPPEHPEHAHFQTSDPWMPPWARPKEEPPKEEALESLFEHQLRARLKEALYRLSTVSPRSKVGKELKKVITALRNEFKRRGVDPNKVEEEVLAK